MNLSVLYFGLHVQQITLNYFGSSSSSSRSRSTIVLTSTRINIELFECVANLGKDGEVTGWKPSNRKYLRGLIYENNTGTFHIKLSGVYQV